MYKNDLCCLFYILFVSALYHKVKLEYRNKGSKKSKWDTNKIVNNSSKRIHGNAIFLPFTFMRALKWVVSRSKLIMCIIVNSKKFLQ